MEIKGKISLLFLAMLLMFSCQSGGRELMTKNEFDAVQTGTSVQVLVKEHGKPYEIRDVNPTRKDYIYIERFQAPHGMREDRHYIFEIVDGKVKDKYFYQEGKDTIDYMLEN